jgi:hypothetical protein
MMTTKAFGTVFRQLRRSFLCHEEPGLSDGQLLECFISGRDETVSEALVRRHGAHDGQLNLAACWGRFSPGHSLNWLWMAAD